LGRLPRPLSASSTLKNAQALAEGRRNTTATSVDVRNEEELDKLVAQHDLVIRCWLQPQAPLRKISRCTDV